MANSVEHLDTTAKAIGVNSSEAHSPIRLDGMYVAITVRIRRKFQNFLYMNTAAVILGALLDRSQEPSTDLKDGTSRARVATVG